MGKQQDRSSTPPADGPPPLGRHDGVEPNIPWSTQATPTIAGTPSPSRRGADPGTAAHLVGAAGYPADPRPPSGSLLNGGAGEHRPAPWQRVHDLPRDKEQTRSAFYWANRREWKKAWNCFNSLKPADGRSRKVVDEFINKTPQAKAPPEHAMRTKS